MNIWGKVCSVTMGIFMLIMVVAPVSAQEEQSSAPVQETAPQQSPKNTFMLEEDIIKNLEYRISEEQFDEINDLKGKEFTEAQLREALQTIALSQEEIDTVLNLVRERQKFVETVSKAAPVALELENIYNDIKQREEVLNSTQLDDERNKLIKEIKEQRKALKQHEHRISEIISDIDGTKSEQIAAVLNDAGHDSDEIEIIKRNILNLALFSKKLGTLGNMAESMEAINKEISEYEQKRKNAGSEEEKKSLSEYLAELKNRLENTTNDFSVLTTGIDYSTFLKREGKEVDWDKEVKDIFSPIIVELKETTERPRKMEQLRSDILYLEKRIPKLQQAAADIDKFLEKNLEKKVRARLITWKEYWQQMEKEFTSQLEADKNQLLQMENERKSLLTSFKVFFDSFVRHRGKSLFFALLAFVAMYLFFRLLQRLVWKVSPLHKSPKYMFWANLTDVMFYGLTFIFATGALIAVLFTSGDWLILAIVMLLVLGVVWGARNTLPHFVEQIKLLLGFGPVRQGEKVIIDGIPYRVEMMGVYSYLKNPLLTGGTLRLPLKDLVDMRSRPYDEKEPWFPCKEGDFVLIDGFTTWRQIKRQTPQFVEFDWFEMIETMPTGDFMGRNIFNMSAAPFWVGVDFTIAYKHRFDAMGDIRDKLTSHVEEEVRKQSYGNSVLCTWIEFAGLTGDSSLSFMISVQFKSDVAPKYPDISLDLTRAALGAANKYAWEIICFKPVEIHHPEQPKYPQGDKNLPG